MSLPVSVGAKTRGRHQAPHGYDIIGDVHGCAVTLTALLEKLGYEFLDGFFQHPSRRAVFLGDIVDRGPRVREALHIVKNMVDADVADCIMGNHEYNAIAYTTPDPIRTPKEGPTRYIRHHNKRHNRQIAETLEQFAPFPEEWLSFLQWFKSLPLFLEYPGFRVVHACWDSQLIERFKREYGGNQVSEEFIRESSDPQSFPGLFLDRLTRGTDMSLPSGVEIHGRDGYVRDAFRTKFWAQDPQTYRDIVFQPDPLPDDIADQSLTAREKKALLVYGRDEPPVFVGHYWLQGTPEPIRSNIACLDYSAVKYGRLVAYSYDGEKRLEKNKFRWVYVDVPDDDCVTTSPLSKKSKT